MYFPQPGGAHTTYPTAQFVPRFVQANPLLPHSKKKSTGAWNFFYQKSTEARILKQIGRWEIRGGRIPHCGLYLTILKSQAPYTLKISVADVADLSIKYIHYTWVFFLKEIIHGCYMNQITNTAQRIAGFYSYHELNECEDNRNSNRCPNVPLCLDVHGCGTTFPDFLHFAFWHVLSVWPLPPCIFRSMFCSVMP